MIEKTDLAYASAIAKQMARFKPVADKDIPLIVKHPFTDYAYFYIGKDAGDIEESVVDITKNEAGFEKFVERCDRIIQITKDYPSYASVITKPYRSWFLKITKEHISVEDMSRYLKTLWITTDTVNVDQFISKEEYVSLFKEADPKVLMNEKEYKIFKKIPDEITVYRGVNTTSNHPVRALSWTRDRKTAQWFANRFVSDTDAGAVYKTTVKKKDVLAYFENEDEIVVNYKNLKKIERI